MKHYTVIPGWTLIMCAHFQVVGSIVSHLCHFGKNFQQKLEYYTELPATFMDSNEMLHINSLRGSNMCPTNLNEHITHQAVLLLHISAHLHLYSLCFDMTLCIRGGLLAL